jgi:hypothetical protein
MSKAMIAVALALTGWLLWRTATADDLDEYPDAYDDFHAAAAPWMQ